MQFCKRSIIVLSVLIAAQSHAESVNEKLAAAIGGEPEQLTVGFRRFGLIQQGLDTFAYRDGTLYILGVYQHIHTSFRCADVRDVQVDLHKKETDVKVQTNSEFFSLRLLAVKHDFVPIQKMIDTFKACAAAHNVKETKL